MSLRARTGDEPLELCGFDGKHFTLVSARAFAPGQPLMVTVELTPPCPLDLKSLGSKLRPDGRYDVRARASTLTKSARERLLEALARPC